MGKRKGFSPRKADAVKRQTLSWNMQDLGHDVIIDDSCASSTHQGNSVYVGCDAQHTQPIARDSNVAVQELIDRCQFYLPIYRDFKPKRNEWSCRLGEVRLEFCFPSAVQDSMPDVSECWLYISKDDPQGHLLYYELDPSKDSCQPAMLTSDGLGVIYYKVSNDWSYSFWEGLCLKSFTLVLREYLPGGMGVVLDLYGNDGILSKLSFSSEGFKPRRIHAALQKIMAQCHGIQTQGKIKAGRTWN